MEYLPCVCLFRKLHLISVVNTRSAEDHFKALHAMVATHDRSPPSVLSVGGGRQPGTSKRVPRGCTPSFFGETQTEHKRLIQTWLKQDPAHCLSPDSLGLFHAWLAKESIFFVSVLIIMFLLHDSRTVTCWQQLKVTCMHDSGCQNLC